MAVALTVIVGFVAGLVFGFLQSLLVGLYVRRWDGGTGCLWGLIIAVPSAIAAVWLTWYAVIFALALATCVLVLSLVQLWHDR